MNQVLLVNAGKPGESKPTLRQIKSAIMIEIPRSGTYLNLKGRVRRCRLWSKAGRVAGDIC